LDSKRQVARDEVENYCKEFGFFYFECSSKSGDGVEDMFLQLTTHMVQRKDNFKKIKGKVDNDNNQNDSQDIPFNINLNLNQIDLSEAQNKIVSCCRSSGI